MRFTILHLTDPHFGPMCYYHDRDPRIVRLRRFLDDLRLAIAGSTSTLQFDAVVFSGDLTWQGQQAGFDVAIEVQRLLVSEFGVSAVNILWVPGNHDLLRPPDPSEEPPRSRFESRPVAESNYRRFFADVAGGAPSRYLSQTRIFNGPRIALLGLNSSRLEGMEHAGLGYVGGGQMADSVTRFWNEVGGRDKAGDFLLIAFMHHHVLALGGVPWQKVIKPRDSVDFLLLECEPVLETLLAANVGLLLHGHRHISALNLLGRPTGNRIDSFMAISSTGSAGLQPPTANATEFKTMEIDEDVIRIVSYRAQYSGGGREPWDSKEVIINKPLIGSARIQLDANRLMDLVKEERNAAVEVSWLEAATILYGDPDAQRWFHAEYNDAARGHTLLSRLSEETRELLFFNLLGRLRSQSGGVEFHRKRAATSIGRGTFCNTSWWSV